MLAIEGLELTQVIQSYGQDKSPIPPERRLPDNAVPLIADKPTFVRVYLNHTKFASLFVNASLEAVAVDNGIAWPLGGTSPLSPMVMGHSDYLDQRADRRKTLNFQIPLAWRHFVEGRTLRLTVRVSGALPRSIEVKFRKSRPLRIATVSVDYLEWKEQFPSAEYYSGPDLSTPTTSDLLRQELRGTRRVFPTARYEHYTYPGNERIMLIGDLKKVSTQYTLLKKLKDIEGQYNKPTGLITLGLLGGSYYNPHWLGFANPIPGGPIVSRVMSWKVFAHELGHCYMGDPGPVVRDAFGHIIQTSSGYEGKTWQSPGEFGVTPPNESVTRWQVRDPRRTDHLMRAFDGEMPSIDMYMSLYRYINHYSPFDRAAPALGLSGLIANGRLIDSTMHLITDKGTESESSRVLLVGLNRDEKEVARCSAHLRSDDTGHLFAGQLDRGDLISSVRVLLDGVAIGSASVRSSPTPTRGSVVLDDHEDSDEDERLMNPRRWLDRARAYVRDAMSPRESTTSVAKKLAVDPIVMRRADFREASTSCEW